MQEFKTIQFNNLIARIIPIKLIFNFFFNFKYRLLKISLKKTKNLNIFTISQKIIFHICDERRS